MANFAVGGTLPLCDTCHIDLDTDNITILCSAFLNADYAIRWVVTPYDPAYNSLFESCDNLDEWFALQLLMVPKFSRDAARNYRKRWDRANAVYMLDGMVKPGTNFERLIQQYLPNGLPAL